ncbi:uridine kinase [Synechococcus sp. RSCCF101]|uniref:uridine kinase n=1 Tax=Synechococcus sp. RSCCF101 TaxID=2511069 RepID=UPI0012465C34|nr:uridine kinase [Synechococcus sp. RSCCF101]QEY31230.1 uridine kinase [Synechococcus sp. RSCCF101]
MIGVSGIDGSGKGYISSLIATRLRESNRSVEVIGIDGWLARPCERFSKTDPAQHFLDHGIRLHDFYHLVFAPLSQTGFLDLITQHSGPGNEAEYVDYHYQIKGPEILVFEGIFLFQPPFAFDYSIWVDCSFETALARAIERNQEGLGVEEILQDYNSIYHAAQRLHMTRDKPKEMATLIYDNDDRRRIS